MSSLLISLFTLACLSIAAFGAGRPLWRWMGADEDTRLTIVTFSVGLGLIGIGWVLIVLGWVGLLNVFAIAGVTILACCWGLMEIGFLWLRTDERIADLLDDPEDPDDAIALAPGFAIVPPRWLLLSVIAAATAMGLWSLFHALTPPTTDGMHSCSLEAAKRFFAEGRITETVAGDPSMRSLLSDVWCLWALVFDGAVGAQLIHWGLGLLLAVGTVVLAAPLVGPGWAWLAGSLVVLTPAIHQQMSLPTESVALAAFCTLGFTAWCQAMLHGGTRAWFIVAGLMAGGAFGIHDAAAMLALTVAVASIWTARRQPEQQQFLRDGGSIAIAVALGVGFLCLLPAICFHVVWNDFDPARTSVAGWPKQLGMVLLAAVPGVVIARRLRGFAMPLLVATSYTGLIVWLGGDSRLLFPVVPLLCIGAVWVVIELQRFPRSARWAATAALLLAFACNAMLSLEWRSNALSVALGLEDRNDYLLQHEPTYRAAAIANRMLRADDRVLCPETGTFYFDCRVMHPSTLRCPASDASGVEAAVRQLQQQGITHLFLAESASSSSPWHRVADAATPVTDYHFRTADGGLRRYRLVSLR